MLLAFHVIQITFLSYCPLNDRKRAARSLLKIGRLFSLKFTLSRPILLISSVSRNLFLTHRPLSGSLDSLLSDLIAPTPGLEFFLLRTRALAAVSSFSSGRTYPFLNFLLPLFSSLDHYSNNVGVNISLNNSSSLSLLNVYDPPFDLL